MKKRFITILLIFLFVSVSAQTWKTYPYHQEGSVLNFPEDEGRHSGEDTEWWYTCAHVVGESTGTEYSYMLTYFYYPAFSFDGFRIFNIANEMTGEFYDETLPSTYTSISEDHLDIYADVYLGSPEEWTTIRDSLDELVPFQYHISAISANGAIEVDYNTVKRPLMVGGTGFLYEGATDYTYYYSQTMVEVSGAITFNGLTEPISGTAWIDRQYGEFNPYGGEAYEWFCIQLDNNMDIVIWNVFDTLDGIPDTSTYRMCSIYIDDSTYSYTSDFELTRLRYSFMSDSAMCYSQQWHFAYADIDLTFETVLDNNEVALPFRFFEGSTIIGGTVAGIPITGIGFAELLHSYEIPDIDILAPDGFVTWSGSQPLVWQILNPDDGRPVYYDLELSIDGRETFFPIVQGLTDTIYDWDISDIEIGTKCWLRVIGYSLDTTLVGINETDTSFIVDPAGIESNNKPIFSFVAYPNPFNSSCAITVHAGERNACPAEVEIYDLRGNRIADCRKGLLTSMRGEETLNRRREMHPTNGTFIWTPDETIASGVYLVRATYIAFGNEPLMKIPMRKIVYLK